MFLFLTISKIITLEQNPAKKRYPT